MRKKSLLSCRHKQTALFDEGDFLCVGYKMTEIWKVIAGFVDYMISNRGQVKSLKWGKELILTPMITEKGYLRVGLYIKNTAYVHRVHQLVAQTFLRECPKGKQINHKDCNKANNHVLNLEYITHSENMHHAAKNGLCKGLKGENNGNSKLTWKKVHRIKKAIKLGKTYTAIADESNISLSTISQIANNKIWKGDQS